MKSKFNSKNAKSMLDSLLGSIQLSLNEQPEFEIPRKKQLFNPLEFYEKKYSNDADLEILISFEDYRKTVIVEKQMAWTLLNSLHKIELGDSKSKEIEQSIAVILSDVFYGTNATPANLHTLDWGITFMNSTDARRSVNQILSEGVKITESGIFIEESFVLQGLVIATWVATMQFFCNYHTSLKPESVKHLLEEFIIGSEVIEKIKSQSNESN